MSSANGPKLAGIGRTSDSDLVLCMDAYDAGSYGGEATVNLFLAPSLWSLSVGATWSGSNGTWGTSTATVESVMGPDGKYIKAIANQHTASGGGTAHIWFFYQYFMGTSLRNVTLTNGTTYTCSWWWKAVNSRSASSNSIYFTGPANYSTSHVNPVTTEWTRVFCDFTFGNATGDYSPGHYFYSCGDDFKVWYAMLQIEEKPYSTPAVRSQLSGFSQQGYNARPASVDLSLNDGSYEDKSPNKLVLAQQQNMAMPGLGGKFGAAAYYFNGASFLKYTVPSGSSALFGTGNFTIDFWHYMPAGTSLKDYATWFSTYTSGYNSGIIIAQHVGTGTYGVWNGSWLNTGVTLLTDQWAHVAIVRHGTGSNECSYYLNGTSIMTFTLSFDFVTATIKEFLVGSLYTANNNYGLEGYMSDVRVCSGTALWRGTNAFTPPTRRSNDGPVLDLSGSNNGGNLATTDSTDVKTNRRGQVIEPVANAIWNFDGTDDGIRGGKGCRVGNTRRKSIEAWVRGVTGGTKTLLFMGDHGNNYKWQWTTLGGGQYMTGSGYGTRYYWSEAPLTAAGWHHWVDVVDEDQGAGDRVKRYVDGILLTPNALTTDTGDSFYDGTDMYVDIGMAELGSGPYGLFDGEIGAIRLYGIALTAQQVKQNLNAQRSRFGV